MSSFNPWVARFERLLDPTVVRELARLVPDPLTTLHLDPIEIACDRLHRAFKELFIPTSQTVAVLMELIGIAFAHSLATYPSPRAILTGLYAKKSPLPDLSVIVCLTGLAGVGKSHLIKALKRIFGKDGRVTVDPEHTDFPVVAAWFLNVREKATIAKMLLSLLGEEQTESDALSDFESIAPEAADAKKRGKPKENRDISSLLKSCRFRAFRDGVSLIPADEFQFATRSERAHALVASMLLHLAAIGAPFMYAANFSLIHRLLKRPQEDLQRLLERRIILLPDTAKSSDWLDTVRGYRDVAPEIFVFKAEEIADDLHKWTAGLKRLLAKLLVLAYRRARETNKFVGHAEIEWAYQSGNYSTNRDEVRLITQQIVTGRMARKDLWCPFELPKQEEAKEREAAKGQRLRDMNTRLVESALTAAERKTYADLQKAAKESTPSTKGRAVSIKTKTPPSMEELRKNEELFRAKFMNQRSNRDRV